MKKLHIKNVFVFFLAIYGVGSFSSQVAASSWYEYKTENFRLLTDVSRLRAKSVIRRLEKFRAGALKFTGKSLGSEIMPVTLIYFDKGGEFRRFYGPGRESVQGFFTETSGGPLMVGRFGSWSIAGQNIVFHEYVHYLMRKGRTLRYPRWYEEGFAELLASANVSGGRMDVGHAPEWREYALNKKGAGDIELRDLLDPQFSWSEENGSEFYADAWLLVHYLLLGELSGNKSYREASAKYILEFSEGADPFESFERNVGVSIEEFSELLLRYKGGKLKGVRLEVGDIDSDIVQRKLSDNEIAKELSLYSIDRFNYIAARKFLERTEKGEPGWEINALLSSILDIQRAADEVEKNEDSAYDEGQAGVYPVIEELPKDLLSDIARQAEKDYQVSGILGRYYYEVASYAGTHSERSSLLLDKSMKFSKLAVELKPESLRAYEHLWRAQNMKNQKVEAFRSMMSAYKYHSSNLFLNYSISVHLIGLERVDLAKPFLIKIVDIGHRDSLVQWAKRGLDLLETQAD